MKLALQVALMLIFLGSAPITQLQTRFDSTGLRKPCSIPSSVNSVTSSR